MADHWATWLTIKFVEHDFNETWNNTTETEDKKALVIKKHRFRPWYKYDDDADE